jgi:transposase InsO family protein
MDIPRSVGTDQLGRNSRGSVVGSVGPTVPSGVAVPTPEDRDVGDVDKVLRLYYYDVKQPSGYTGPVPLFKEARKMLPRLTMKEVQDWLSKEFAYTLHKPARRNFVRNPVVVHGIDEEWMADLVDMREFSRQNDGYNYILTVIDCFSKFAWGVPLKSKTGVEVSAAFKKIFNDAVNLNYPGVGQSSLGRIPAKLQTDKAKEFMNKEMSALLKQKEILYFTTHNQTIKCSIVERFNRTLKTRMFKYFTAKGTRRYIDILQDLITAYNSSKHRSIRMRPIDVNSSNEGQVFTNLYKAVDQRDFLLKTYMRERSKPKIKEGTYVRQQHPVKPFDKGYYPLWQDKLYKVKKGVKAQTKPMYHVTTDQRGTDGTGQMMEQPSQPGRLYKEQLQEVQPSLYRVEAILDRRIRRGRGRGRGAGVVELLIKWVGYDDNHNSWEPEQNVLNL